MQKKLIALAVAGLVSGGAFAQSNVTISGQFRVGIDSVSASGATAANADLTSRTRVTDENSTVRLAGEEKLGNGLTAWFQVESAIGTADNIGTTGAQGGGAVSTGIGTRNTAVGLKGNFGNFWVGKWDTHYSSHAGVDANGLAAHGIALTTNALSILHTNNGGNGAGGRNNNAIMYTTPNFSGFDMNVGYTTTAGAGGIGNETTAAGVDKESGVWINPRYTNGPIHAFYSYYKRSNVGNAASGTSPDAKFTRLGAAYTFPMGVKIGFIWDKNECSTGSAAACTVGGVATAASTTTERKAWALPVSYTTGAHTISYTYAKADNTCTGGADIAATGAKMNMLGYTYAMSKRTSLGLSWYGITNEAAAMYDGWHPSSSVGAGAMAAGADPRKFTFQINHTY